MRRKIRFALDRYRNLRKARHEHPVVVVYQMGKVGSSSLFEHLQTQISGPLFKVHRFNLNNDALVIRSNAKMAARKYWAERILARIKDKPLKLVCMTREPVARNISDFFQTFGQFEKDEKIDKKEMTASQLLHIFLEKYPHHSVTDWFDLQLNDVFGIDVYRDAYHTCRNGSLLYHKENIELLVFRLENRDQSIHDVAEFLNIPDFELPQSNMGNKKWYAKVYREFKELPLPQDYIDRLQRSDYYRFFYGDPPFVSLEQHPSNQNS